MKDIREDEAWWSPVWYTVDNFWFEEEGAVLGDANEFVNHSRLLGIARGRSGEQKGETGTSDQSLGGHGGGSLFGEQDSEGSLFYIPNQTQRMTHHQTTIEPAHHASVCTNFPHKYLLAIKVICTRNVVTNSNVASSFIHLVIPIIFHCL